MRKTISNILRELRQLEKRRTKIMTELLVAEPFIKGSLSKVKRRCGKPTCHCAEAPAHEVWVISSQQDQVRRSQVVRLADVEAVQRRIAIYKAFRVALKKLDATQIEQKALLRGLMEERNAIYE